jgi:hypothetical protein
MNYQFFNFISLYITGLRISSGGNREFARGADRLLQPLDGRREATDSKRMVIRSPDGAARSVRAVASITGAGTACVCVHAVVGFYCRYTVIERSNCSYEHYWRWRSSRII